MRDSLTEDQMRQAPLTLADLRAVCRSAHAFWKMPLKCAEHDAGLDVVVFSNGTLETHCRECKMLLGVLKLDRGDPVPSGAGASGNNGRDQSVIASGACGGGGGGAR